MFKINKLNLLFFLFILFSVAVLPGGVNKMIFIMALVAISGGDYRIVLSKKNIPDLIMLLITLIYAFYVTDYGVQAQSILVDFMIFTIIYILNLERKRKVCDGIKSEKTVKFYFYIWVMIQLIYLFTDTANNMTDDRGFRFGGSLSPASLAICMVPFILYFASKKGGVGNISALLVSIAILLATQSRAPIGAVILGFIYIRAGDLLRRWIVYTLLFFILFFYGLYFYAPDIFNTIMIATDINSSGRFNVWSKLVNFGDNNDYGYGFGAYQKLIGDGIDINFEHFNQPHSDLIRLFLIFGKYLSLVFICMLFRQINNHQSGFRGGMLISTIVMMLSDNLLIYHHFLILFAVMIYIDSKEGVQNVSICVNHHEENSIATEMKSRIFVKKTL